MSPISVYSKNYSIYRNYNKSAKYLNLKSGCLSPTLFGITGKFDLLYQNAPLWVHTRAKM